MSPALEYRLQQIIVQIATPESTGTGFVWPNKNLIICNEHLVRGYNTIVVASIDGKKQLTSLLYSDPLIDLALLFLPDELSLNIEIEAVTAIPEHQAIPLITGGKLFGDHYCFAQGYTDVITKEYGVAFVKHTAHLDTTYSGGPVIDKNGRLLGINSFANWEEDKFGLLLPAMEIETAIQEIEKNNFAPTAKCLECRSLNPLVFEAKKCVVCNTVLGEVSLEKAGNQGIPQSIENILNDLGHNVQLARVGPYRWDIERGSATISISYFEKNGLIIGDAYLCFLPSYKNTSLLKYLLEQNNYLDGLSFGIKESQIVLSLIMFDRHLHHETALKRINYLCSKADEYDNILVERFGAVW